MPRIRLAGPQTFALAALLATLPVGLAQDAGDLPDEPNTLTVDNQMQYATIVLADTRPVVLGEHTSEPSYYFRLLRQQYKVPVKFSWDSGAVKFLTDKNWLMTSLLQDLTTDLVTGISNGQSIYLKEPLSKIKEIRLTTTTKRWSSQNDITGDGYYPTFNTSNGLLTVALSTTQGINREVDGIMFSSWIIANVK